MLKPALKTYRQLVNLKYIMLALIILFSSACFFERSGSYKRQADKYRKSADYEEAIAAYYKHIEERLAVTPRPDWDNPYIYLLDIGDIYLEQGDVDRALKTYEEAEEKEVKSAYCNDRYRAVALWYEKRGELKKSLEILEHYRERDPFLMELMLDRLARQLVAEEDAPKSKVTAKVKPKLPEDNHNKADSSSSATKP